MSCIWLILDKKSNIADHEVYFPIDSQVKNWSKTNSKEKFFISGYHLLQVFTFNEVDCSSGEILVDEVYKISNSSDLIRQAIIL